VSNRRTINVDKLTRALARDMTSPRASNQPDRRPRACCGSRQGFPHFAGCAKLPPVVQLVVDEDMGRAIQARLGSDEVRARIDALPDAQMTVKL
jgi:hypothetical protein